MRGEDMIIEGKVIKLKNFGSYCAIILDVGKSFVRALTYTDIPIIEGEKYSWKGTSETEIIALNSFRKC